MIDETKKSAEETAPAAAPEVASKAVEKAELPSPEETKATESEEFEVPSKFKKLVQEVETMTVLELSELVKVLEKKFGVSAAAVAVAPAAGGAGAAAEEEGKSTVDVELTDAGASKIGVIKAVKEALGLGLKEAKDLVDGVPSMLKQGMKKEEAGELAKKLTDVGAKVTLK